MHLGLVALFALAVSGTDATGAYGRQEPLELRAATPNTTSVPCFSLFELKVDLGATYDNAFDPADVDLGAAFLSPDGKEYRVNGFLSQAFTRRLENGGERIEPDGEPFWAIRFSPNREGAWKYRVTLRDRSGTVELPEAEFTATPSASPGMVRRNAQSPHIFAFDNGKPFVPIGENMCWPKARGTFDYDDWLPQLSQAGGNWIRIWMFRWSCGLEWGPVGKADWETDTFKGLGVYKLASAWKLDTILDSADRNGVYAMLCLGTYGEFMRGGYFNEGLWDSNPYNAANGGPCVKPEDFWTHEQARSLYKRRLRYLAARYGWRSNLFAWEFWNEAHPTTEWIAEMTAYLKGLGTGAADPYGHLVSTTYGTPEIWQLPEVDFTMTHHYGQGDIPDSAPVIVADADRHRTFGKPHLMAEFGIDWRSSDDKYDPEFLGVNLHNGIWASMLSGNAGGAMLWYWESYVHPGKVYEQFTPLRRFVDAIPWQEGPWNPLKIDPAQVQPDPGTWRDLVLAPSLSWEKDSIGDFSVSPVGGVGNAPLPAYLFSPSKPDLRSPLVFHVNYETVGRFLVRVNSVSSQVTLRILLDGRPALEKALSALPPEKGGPSEPEYKSTAFKPEYGIYQASFDREYGIDVPAGSHTIALEAGDGDWVSLAQYRFEKYVSDRFARVNFCGITNGVKAYLWIQNAEHNWVNRTSGTAVPVIRGASTNLQGLADGTYACTWWDTWKGEVKNRENQVCKGGALSLVLPDLDTDVAVSLEILPAS